MPIWQPKRATACSSRNSMLSGLALSGPPRSLLVLCASPPPRLTYAKECPMSDACVNVESRGVAHVPLGALDELATLRGVTESSGEACEVLTDAGCAACSFAQ